MECDDEHLLPFAHSTILRALEVWPVEFRSEDSVDGGIARGVELAECSVMKVFSIVGT